MPKRLPWADSDDDLPSASKKKTPARPAKRQRSDVEYSDSGFDAPRNDASRRSRSNGPGKSSRFLTSSNPVQSVASTSPLPRQPYQRTIQTNPTTLACAFSSSPPPAELPLQPPTPAYMRPGLAADDAFVMVEDEFLATARVFTKHLHAAEYARLKTLARTANSEKAHTISRAVDGRTEMSREARIRVRGLERGERVGEAVERVGGDLGEWGREEEEREVEEEGWIRDPRLMGLMRRPEVRRVRLEGLVGVRGDTRMARGFGKMDVREEEKDGRESGERTGEGEKRSGMGSSVLKRKEKGHEHISSILKPKQRSGPQDDDAEFLRPSNSARDTVSVPAHRPRPRPSPSSASRSSSTTDFRSSTSSDIPLSTRKPHPEPQSQSQPEPPQQSTYLPPPPCPHPKYKHEPSTHRSSSPPKSKSQPISRPNPKFVIPDDFDDFGFPKRSSTPSEMSQRMAKRKARREREGEGKDKGNGSGNGRGVLLDEIPTFLV
ncbi:hypothetical protein K402DRAFT_452015 [Aulographum hederae CBS 113979]|uniref:Uncharacterized protein n=1 Tax=Aulographum hederae CBS 113979 TaxID=1176131 RepID=A0A6G1H861_9PEZI|nr:hypothetical protein K402DRAFT_452015 [Aulographum hederae CBS 113979]